LRYFEDRDSRNRFRVIVSKKLEKQAVKRNRIRRQLYEALRLLISEIKQDIPRDIVIIPKKTILNKSFDDIKDYIRTKPYEVASLEASDLEKLFDRIRQIVIKK
jgi:ribonuclease P protein component